MNSFKLFRFFKLFLRSFQTQILHFLTVRLLEGFPSNSRVAYRHSTTRNRSMSVVVCCCCCLFFFLLLTFRFGRCALTAVDGGWESWSAWSDCPEGCGFALQFRNRACSNPPPSSGGQACHGLAHHTSVCDTELCNGSHILRSSLWFRFADFDQLFS